MAAGGVAGFASKGSVPSLVAGGISGLGLIACGRTSNFKAAAVISATWHSLVVQDILAVLSMVWHGHPYFQQKPRQF